MKKFYYYFSVVSICAILMHFAVTEILLPLKWHSEVAVIVFFIATNYLLKLVNFIKQKFILSDLYDLIYNSNFSKRRRRTYFERLEKKSIGISLLEIFLLISSLDVILYGVQILVKAKTDVGIALFTLVVAFFLSYSFSISEFKYNRSNFVEVDVKNFLKKILNVLSFILIIVLIITSCVLIIKSIDSVFDLIIWILIFLIFIIKILIPAIKKTRRELEESIKEMRKD